MAMRLYPTVRKMAMEDISLEILEAAAQGDIGAFEQVYKAVSGFVYNVALRITRNNIDAQEVTQDVFMKIYHKLKAFQFRSEFKTWVYRITVNTAINYYRKSARQDKGRVSYDGVIESSPGGVSTAEGAIQNESKAMLNFLLGQLNPEHKACLVLRELEGLSYQQIAEVLRIPVNTVRSRLKRARQALLEMAGKAQVKYAL